MIGDWRVETASDGTPTLCKDGRYIHSRYNPSREAERSISLFQPGIDNPKWIIIIGEGLGYICEAMHRKFPDAFLIPLFFHPLISIRLDQRVQDNSCYQWFYQNEPLTLYHFLISTIPDHHADAVSIFTWQASLHISPEVSSVVLKETSQAITFLASNNATVRGFSGKWLKNSLSWLKSNSSSPPLVDFSTKESAVLVAASGPELNDYLPLIKKFRKAFLLCALPSSILALEAMGLVPDMILHADPGYWARFHLSKTSSPPSIAGPVLISALSGSPAFQHLSPTWKNRFSGMSFFLEDDSPFSPIDSLDSPFPLLPARGTVAANALDLFLSKGTGPIFFVGLDLSNKDLQSHVKPHTFDSRFFSSTGRTESIETIRFKRALSGPAGSNLDIYRRFFSTHLSHNRLFRFSDIKENVIGGIISYSREIFVEMAEHLPKSEMHITTLDRSDCTAPSLDNFFSRIALLRRLSRIDYNSLLSRGSGSLSLEEKRLLRAIFLIGDGKPLSKDRFEEMSTALEKRLDHD
jgi:hypothetical protein